MTGEVVWWPAGSETSRDSVAVVTVSYNTRELTAFLLWSLRTLVSWPDLEIVVVDNGSRDGSAELLAEAERGGVCTALVNRENRQHGPGLNQAISYLAGQSGPRPAWIWILDSDVVAARPDALSAAVTVAREQPAALVGEPQQDQWRLLTEAVRRGTPMTPFPFTAAGHLIHRGRGSLAAVYAAGDRSHSLYEWSVEHRAPHFNGVPGAEQRYYALLQEFRDRTGALTGTTLAAACRRSAV